MNVGRGFFFGDKTFQNGAKFKIDVGRVFFSGITREEFTWPEKG